MEASPAVPFQRTVNLLALLIVGAAVGALATALWHGELGRTNIHATASMGQDNFIIATGLVDEDIEGLFFLDFLTGDLRAAIVSRRSGKFTGFFEYNVTNDFGTMAQNPKYLMVTGLVDLPASRGAMQIGRSMVYVAEASTGQVFAYALPFSSTLNAAGKLQTGTFLRMDGGPFRTQFVRGE